jgi:hypothetical protein
MTDAATPLVAEDDDPTALDRAAALIGPQLRLLERLAEIGVELAEAIVVQAKDAAAPRVCQGDLSLAYTRVSRAVRQALMLQSKLIAALAALDAAEADIDPSSPRADPDYQIKARVERVIARTAQAQHEDDEDGDEADEAFDRLIADAAERLDDIDLYGDLLQRPMSEIVARIAHDIGLPLDWTVLAQEAWAQAEMQGDEVGAPLAALRTEPAETLWRPPQGGAGLSLSPSAHQRDLSVLRSP